MGVQGLTTFVEGNRNFLQDVRLRNCRLIIDGSSLYYNLYFKHGLDQQHGGDYDAFTCLLQQFFSALASCNIQPFVVLDGGMDPSDKKFTTIRQRIQDKIKHADSISRNRFGSVLPLLTKEVFIQFLNQSGIPLVQCPHEADWELACLAKHWNCPILSNDSDFYIFDLPGGYLPLNYFNWNNLSGKATQQYISARQYTTSSLCRWFDGLNKDLLPLCAVLIGNDYGSSKEVELLLSSIEANIVARVGKGGKGAGSTSRIAKLLFWLSSFSGPTEALTGISQLAEEDARFDVNLRGKSEAVSVKLWKCMQEYNTNSDSSLDLWFSDKKVLPSGWTKLGLPAWLANRAAQGQLAASIVDAMVMQRVLLIPQVENAKLASSHNTALFIRQSMYEILLGRLQKRLTQGEFVGQHVASEMIKANNCDRVEKCQYFEGGGGKHCRQKDQMSVGIQAQRSAILVDEYDRLGLNLKKNQVNVCPRLSALDAIDQASSTSQLAVLLEILGVTESALISVPLHLRLAVAVTIFWQREAKPTPTKSQLDALLMGFVYGEFNIQQYTGSVKALTKEHGLSAAMTRKRKRPGERRHFDLADANSYCQWQACLWAALCLNQILMQPIPEPYLSWSFSGTLVHGLAKYLKEGGVPESLLPKSTLSEQLFSTLLFAVNKSILKSDQAFTVAGKRERRGRRRKPGTATGKETALMNRATANMDNRFALLMSEEENEA